MQEQNASIALTDQELATQTHNLQSIGQGAHRDCSEQMELKAEVATGSQLATLLQNFSLKEVKHKERATFWYFQP